MLGSPPQAHRLVEILKGESAEPASPGQAAVGGAGMGEDDEGDEHDVEVDLFDYMCISSVKEAKVCSA